jgi:ABC-2 family transporter protein
MLTQTCAIFVDAYRELNSKKMFWIVLGISLMIVVALGLPSNNEKGVELFGFTLEIPVLSTQAVSPAGFYKFLFANTGVKLWLTWGAMILALISTAGMIPDMIASGSIETVLSKPIGRVRLFLTKYLAGLMFVALQTLVFSVCAFAVIGIRGGSWSVSVFTAVPLVVLIYSFLFSVCALLGLLTRSGIAALLITLLFWLMLFSINTAESALLDERVRREADVARSRQLVESLDKALPVIRKQLEIAEQSEGAPAAKVREPEPAVAMVNGPTDAASPMKAEAGEAVQPAAPKLNRWQRRDLQRSVRESLKNIGLTGNATVLRDRLAEQQKLRDRTLKLLTESEASVKSVAPWHRVLFAVKTVLPKTSETSDLLLRYVIDKKDRDGILKMIEERMDDADSRRIADERDSRGEGWIIGTSLGFQAVILGIACLIFARRDF